MANTVNLQVRLDHELHGDIRKLVDADPRYASMQHFAALMLRAAVQAHGPGGVYAAPIPVARHGAA